ncbi:MAG TPA: aminotransferase class III-fold pyridoxal phosphate-dependent enzyme [Mycobacteriales bacterium]|nr:aminotransferase class III-fold pyridoxal phosphate-dependent enzyme [Mycobacteriales bacterium]
MTTTTADLLARRAAHVAPSLSIHYQGNPIHVARGAGQYLYGVDGTRYLDCINNVALVGHSHPRVVSAVARQMAQINTNTRFLYEPLVDYAEALTSLLPAPLDVCYFVNSGSEANELALRLARAHTRRRGVLVLDHAYHGNTTSLVDISPYKFNGPGGEGRQSHVQIAPAPDTYRGPHRGTDAAQRYADDVQAALLRGDATGKPVGLFIAEPILGCAGQVEPPPGYLAAAFNHARAAGAVVAADEVQVGFGRVGTHMWGFELHGVTPDIVTMGKPIGNGFPLGAVVTTSEIAASFNNGMEYFNTFGGNPVACAAGLAVLDVLAEERLAEHVVAVSEHLVNGFRHLATKHEVIGDIRGRGLFLGVDLVTNRDSSEPATELATHLVGALREQGLLVSTEGPGHNVLKLKPPLPFTESDADELLEAIDRALVQ